MTSETKDGVDRAANYFPWRDKGFRLANDVAYLRWLREQKAKFLAARSAKGEK